MVYHKKTKKEERVASIVLAIISIAISGFGAVIGWKAYKAYLKDHESE